METEPEEWENREDYQLDLNVISGMKVVNACRMRSDPNQNYNNIHTNTENQKQYLLQVVGEHRKSFLMLENQL